MEVGDAPRRAHGNSEPRRPAQRRLAVAAKVGAKRAEGHVVIYEEAVGIVGAEAPEADEVHVVDAPYGMDFYPEFLIAVAANGALQSLHGHRNRVRSSPRNTAPKLPCPILSRPVTLFWWLGSTEGGKGGGRNGVGVGGEEEEDDGVGGEDEDGQWPGSIEGGRGCATRLELGVRRRTRTMGLGEKTRTDSGPDPSRAGGGQRGWSWGRGRGRGQRSWGRGRGWMGWGESAMSTLISVGIACKNTLN